MPPTDEHHLPVGEPVPGWTARALPRPGPFHGGFCSVVPLSVEHADAMYPTCAAPGTERLWTYLSDGPYPDQGAFRARVERTVAASARAVHSLRPRFHILGRVSHLLDEATRQTGR